MEKSTIPVAIEQASSHADASAQNSNAQYIEAAPGLATLCTTDSLLLTRYPVEALYGSPLPKPCCDAGVLPSEESWRCQLDWPSGDIPPCSLWVELKADLDELIAKRSTLLTSQQLAQTRDNRIQLNRWAQKGWGCFENEPPGNDD